MAKLETIIHPIPPLYDKDSKILILGSFPSVKSREAAFFYGHPQNRFWKVVSGVLSEETPTTVEEKAEFLHRNHIAVWDTIGKCDIVGSADSSIKNVEPNDLSIILDHAPIEAVFCNGAASQKYYDKYQEKLTGIKAVKLPSTSPANAAFSVERLKNEWKQICIPLGASQEGIGNVLLDWYDYNARILPWRSDPTPYHVWISEIMLQQTRVEAVIRYYDRWMETLPDIRSLAAADEELVLKLWEGLGYYTRARNIHAAAKEVVEKYNGELPADYEKLLALPGIGEYTAGAISSIAFGLPEPAIDGNAIRVFTRILAYDGEISKAKTKKHLRRELERTLPKDRPGDFNQALMDLGARVCLPNGAPLCEQCPWESVCQARKTDTQTKYPVKAAKKARRVENLGVFVLETEDGIILHKRAEKGLLANLWEFPNVDGSFTIEKASQQLADWSIGIDNITSLGEHKHIFSHVEWQMSGYRARISHISKELLEQNKWIIVPKEQLEQQYAIPSAFEAYKLWK